MSDIQFGPLISGEEIKSEYRRRFSQYEYKTVKGSKMSLILEKVKVKEKEGWEKEKRNKKSYKLKKIKPNDERLEDELWCIAANMGYKTLSSGRNFKIETKKGPNPRQIDVFAKDDEVALVIECTQVARPTKKNMSKLIEKISAIKGDISKAITKQFGRDYKIKPKFVIATRNVEWGAADLEKCKNEGISVLTETEIDYFKALTKFLKSAARYQFHAQLFSESKIPALDKKISATRGTMGGVPFYNFLISPDDLLKISYVGHKASRTEEAIETYQRMLQPNRMKAIAEFIDSGGKFPTNIVLNFKTKGRRKLNFDASSKSGDVALGTLTLPNTFGSAWVIDGQHRLYGYAYRELKNGPKNDKSVLSVLAFENLPAKDEMDMFIDINSKQVKVQKGLLVELYADLHWNSPIISEKMLALQARIVARLNSQKTSPIFDRVVVTGKGKTPFRCLTQTTIADGLAKAQLLGSIKKIKGEEYYTPGPIADHDPKKFDKSLKKAVYILSESLDLFASRMPEHWQLGDRPGGYLCTNIAIRSIFHVIGDICEHVEFSEKCELSVSTADEVFDEVKKYLMPLVNYFGSATPDKIQAFRRQGSSLAAVKKQAMGMNVIIKEAFKDYRPTGLEEYIESRDEEGNEKGQILVGKIQTQIFKHVVSTLKEEFGEVNKKWWTEGVPYTVRKACGEEWEKEKRTKPEESYLYLLNYSSIAKDNWELLGASFALGEKDQGNRAKCLSWVKELNDIRNKAYHPEKENLTTEEVKFVEDLHEKIIEYFPVN